MSASHADRATNRVLTDARILTMVEPSATGLAPIQEGAIALEGERITWVGAERGLPNAYSNWPREQLEGRLVTPGLIDCHTHLVHAGHRAREFEMRLEGASYEEIARAGGGIRSTVKATRTASEATLVVSALKRLDHLIAEGVTTVEIKSGYGLDVETECRMLRAARRLEGERPVSVKTTFLGAHAIPEEYAGRADAYIDMVCDAALPAAVADGRVDAVDAFCESIACTLDQTARVFNKAKEMGLPIKLHAEQLSNLGGAKMAARLGALSCDHLEYLDEGGVRAMAQSGSVAVLLPGAFYTIHETQKPPVTMLREAGVPIAVATDANPGSSPMTSLLLAMNMAATLFGLTPSETLAGVTREAARALGCLDDRGTLQAGKRADIAVWDVEEAAELSYRIGYNPCVRRIFGGTG